MIKTSIEKYQLVIAMGVDVSGDRNSNKVRAVRACFAGVLEYQEYREYQSVLPVQACAGVREVQAGESNSNQSVSIGVDVSGNPNQYRVREVRACSVGVLLLEYREYVLPVQADAKVGNVMLGRLSLKDWMVSSQSVFCEG